MLSPLANPSSVSTTKPQSQPSSSPVDLSFLLNPELYHNPLPPASPPQHPAFPPPPSLTTTSLPTLLDSGHFRPAASLALQTLLQQPSPTPSTVFPLLYTRLATLILLHRPDLAAHESAPLAERLARGSLDPDVVPWDLRVLLVRLQGMVGDEGGRRRGVMGLYSLAGEARAKARATSLLNNAEREVWRDRVRDLGLRAADALVEMGELETAGRHLEGLGGEGIIFRRALLKVRVGDVKGARALLEGLEAESAEREVLHAVVEVADGNYGAATARLRACAANGDATAANNLAVVGLYTGHIATARQILEDLLHLSHHSDHSHDIDDDEAGTVLPATPSVLFNLCTLYELCTERAGERKEVLARRMARRTPGPEFGGWERAGVEFKL